MNPFDKRYCIITDYISKILNVKIHIYPDKKMTEEGIYPLRMIGRTAGHLKIDDKNLITEIKIYDYFIGHYKEETKNKLEESLQEFVGIELILEKRGWI